MYLYLDYCIGRSNIRQVFMSCKNSLCTHTIKSHKVNFSKEFIFLYVSIYINIYNALYAGGTIHNNTIGMAHKKQVEKLNST